MWNFSEQGGLTQIDAPTGIAYASVPVEVRVLDVALSRDGHDVFVIGRDRRQIRDGVVAPEQSWPERAVLERWDLATGTRRWTTDLERDLGGTWLFHVGVGPLGVVLLRCSLDTKGCKTWDVAADTGALHERKTFPLPFWPRWWGQRVESATGRWVLRGLEPRGGLPDDNAGMVRVTAHGSEPMPPAPQVPMWTVLDHHGVPRARVRATCARFDRGDTLWLERADAGGVASVRALGIAVKEGASACTPQPAAALPPSIGPRSGSKDFASFAVTNHHVVWQPSSWLEESRMFSVDVDAVSLPTSLALPAVAPDYWWLSESSSSSLFLRTTGRALELTDVGATAIEHRPFRDGFLQSSGDYLLLSMYNGDNDREYVSSVGTRSSDGKITWQKLAALAGPRLPEFAVIERYGRRTVVLASGNRGLQWADLATGKLVAQVCPSEKDAKGRCQGDYVFSLLPAPDGATAWSYHMALKETKRTQTFEEIDLTTGRVLRSIQAPDLDNNGVIHLLRWLEPGRRFWLSVANCFTVVTLGEPPELAQRCLRGSSAEIDPRGRFIVAFRAIDTVDVLTPEGAIAVTYATRGSDAFAMTPDGRFACTGEACNDLRCIAGDESRPADDTACASLRVPGFTLLDEVARAATAR